MSRIPGFVVAGLLSTSIAVPGFAPAAQAKGYKVLHDFGGAPTDGDRSQSDVTLDSAGNLYGTTYFGGASNNGAVFMIAPDGTETLLHSFTGSDGANPSAGVTLDALTGDLYGVTSAGGSTGYGVLYKIAAGGAYTVLHTFAGSPNDGRYPKWRMIRDKKGNLYGVTQAGGPLDEGILYKYGKNGSFTALYNFDTTSGSPVGRLARDGQDNLYGALGVGGTSHACSSHGCGAIYRLSPDGTFAILYSFSDNDDGRYPATGVILDKSGNLYGTSAHGGADDDDCGAMFRLTPGGDFNILYDFNVTQGCSTAGEVLLVNSDLYVTTTGGGANNLGTVIKVSTTGKGGVLHDFAGEDGSEPSAGLVNSGRLLYGTARLGGASDHGVVFRMPKK